MTIREECLEIINRLQALCFGQFDPEAVLLLDEHITWFDSEKTENGIAEVRRRFVQECATYAGGFEVEQSVVNVAPCGDACIATGSVFARAKTPGASDIAIRFTIVLVRHSAGLRIKHVHVSKRNRADEAAFGLSGTQPERAQTRRPAHQTERALATLTENIPGGLHRCRNDAALTLLSFNSGFLDMFGYTREDIRTRFADAYMNMVLESDRAALRQKIGELQRNDANTFEMEYRVLHASGELRWVLDKARMLHDAVDGESLYGLLIDITERKRGQSALRLSLERHQVILDQTTDIIFEWELATDTMNYSAKWETQFGYAPISSNIKTDIVKSTNIHAEDIPLLREMVEGVLQGVPYLEREIRIKDREGRNRWCRVRATVQYDEDGEPIKAIGVIADIDREKKHTQHLIEQAQKDGLTGLLNRSATQNAIEQSLYDAGRKLQALFIIDLDNFKQVNDCFGHLCGDAVLADTAMVLKNSFRATDVIGRIGGDEFLAFIPDLPDKKTAINRAEAIGQLMQNIEEHLQLNMPVSCSIGIAFSPFDAAEYSELYHCADCALYYVKNNTKNSCAVYDPAMSATRYGDAERSAVHTLTDFDVLEEGDSKLACYCLRTLSRADDLAVVIPQVLEIVGRAFEASRVYIFESSEDGTRCSNTFAWCEAGVLPQSECLQNLRYHEDLEDYPNYFDERGVFTCPNIEKMPRKLQALLREQKMDATLQYAVREQGAFLGFIGFDRCASGTYWTHEQIESMVLIANVISVFLRKMHMQRQLERLQNRAH